MMKKLHYSFGYYLREVTRHLVCTWHWRMSASGFLTGESEFAAILRDACALRTHAPQDEGGGCCGATTISALILRSTRALPA
jgi:hypothetical protein